ncbi:hypothetical protein OAC07_03875 [Candidatus Pelagibacter sp.]|jgi:hypothetical protein|nr:hypothetical protein [Candidatus Pelagibacter sp.]
MFGFFNKKVKCDVCDTKIDAPKNKNPDKIKIWDEGEFNLHGPGQCPKCKTSIVLIDLNGKYQSRIKILFDAQVEWSKYMKMEYKGEISEKEMDKQQNKLEKAEEKADAIKEKIEDKKRIKEEKIAEREHYKSMRGK